MAKKPKVPLNVLVVDGTREAVKNLSNILECSQGEVIDRAVILLGANHDVAKGLAGVNVPAAQQFNDLVNATEQDEPERVVDTRPKNAYCKHCGNRFAGAKFATICPECKSNGHTMTPAECPACNDGRAI